MLRSSKKQYLSRKLQQAPSRATVAGLGAPTVCLSIEHVRLSPEEDKRRVDLDALLLVPNLIHALFVFCFKDFDPSTVTPFLLQPFGYT